MIYETFRPPSQEPLQVVHVLDAKYQVNEHGVIDLFILLQDTESKPVHFNIANIKINNETIQKGDVFHIYTNNDQSEFLWELIYRDRVPHPTAITVTNKIAYCPVCKETAVPIEDSLLCVNYFCPSIRYQKIFRFLREVKNLNITASEWLAIRPLIDYGILKDIIDLYRLTKEMIILNSPYATEEATASVYEKIQISRNIKNIYNTLEAIKPPTIHHWYINPQTINEFTSLPDFLNWLKTPNRDTESVIKYMSVDSYVVLANFFNNENNLREYLFLHQEEII